MATRNTTAPGSPVAGPLYSHNLPQPDASMLLKAQSVTPSAGICNSALTTQ